MYSISPPYQSRRTRRQQITALLASATMLVLSSSCQKMEEVAGAKTATKDSSPASGNKRKVVLANWQDYFSEDLLKGFTKETGIEVELHAYDNIEALEAVMQEDNSLYDVVVAHSSYHKRFQDHQLIQPIRHNSLKNLSNIDPSFHNKDSNDPLYHVPYLWGLTTLAYNNQLTQEPTSWYTLWDAKYRGKIALLNDYEDLLAICLIAAGHPLNSQESYHIQDALTKLPSLLNNAGPKEEGAIMWLDALLITRDPQNVPEAHEFIDYSLRPKVAANNANAVAYMTPNAAAKDFLDPSLTSNEVLNPKPEILERCLYFTGISEEIISLHNQFHALVQERIRELNKEKQALSQSQSESKLMPASSDSPYPTQP